MTPRKRVGGGPRGGQAEVPGREQGTVPGVAAIQQPAAACDAFSGKVPTRRPSPPAAAPRLPLIAATLETSPQFPPVPPPVPPPSRHLPRTPHAGSTLALIDPASKAVQELDSPFTSYGTPTLAVHEVSVHSV